MPLFMNKIEVKSINIVQHERFTLNAKDDNPIEVRPMRIEQLIAMEDTKNKDLYILPNPPVDIQTGVFKVCLI